jgi:hypothetical protein
LRSLECYFEEVVQWIRVVDDSVCNGCYDPKVVCDSTKDVIDGGRIKFKVGEV